MGPCNCKWHLQSCWCQGGGESADRAWERVHGLQAYRLHASRLASLEADMLDMHTLPLQGITDVIKTMLIFAISSLIAYFPALRSAFLQAPDAAAAV